MSRKMSGGGGSSRSFGSGGSGGSRSFGGVGFNGNRSLPTGSSSKAGSSSGNYSGSLGNDGIEDVFSGIVAFLIGCVFSFFGIKGLILVAVTIGLAVLLIHFPMVGGISVFAVVVAVCLFFALRKKKEVKTSLIDLIGDNPKYDPEILHSDDFERHVQDKLRDRKKKKKKGDLDSKKIDIAMDSFDEIYRSYKKPYHYLNPETKVTTGTINTNKINTNTINTNKININEINYSETKGNDYVRTSGDGEEGQRGCL